MAVDYIRLLLSPEPRITWLASFVILCVAASAQTAAPAPSKVTTAIDAEHFAESIADQHGVVSSSDQACLFYRYWPATSPRAGNVVIVLHGIGYHSGPYKVVADALNPYGIDVYGLDARGHGLSCGRRGYTGSPQQVADDLGAMVSLVKQQRPSAEVFLLGDSMGCDYALDYAKQHQDEIAGLILLAPAFHIDKRQLFRFQSLLLTPYFLFARRKPIINLVGKRLNESSRDPDFIARRRTDPLAYKKVSFGYLLDIQHLIKNWKRDIAPVVHTPILMIKGGKDVVIRNKDCVTFMKLSASRDKELKIYPEVRHTTLWDLQTPEILRYVQEWVARH